MKESFILFRTIRVPLTLVMISAVVCAVVFSCSPGTHLTLAVVNARVWTGNPDHPWDEALGVYKNEIRMTGPNEKIRASVTEDTKVIDGKGRLVTPGFIDSHLHFISGGLGLSSVQLRDADSPEEFIRRLKDYAESLEPGAWILDGDWDHTLWGGELPRKDWIDSVTADHPVWINRLDGHMALANSLALELAGVSSQTPDIDGGTIVRMAGGEPTGILKDNAMVLIEKEIPDPTDSMKDRALETAMDYVLQHGVTSVHHMGSWDDIRVFERAHHENRLRTRVYASVPLSSWERLKARIDEQGDGDDWFRVGGLKGYVDGSLGAHTAAFLWPYDDAPEDSGLIVTSKSQLYNRILEGDRAGLQVMVHAIGDRAIRILLDIYQQVSEDNGERDRRFRVEHAQHIHPDDIPRFHQLGVIASIQPYHAIDDGRWAEPLIGQIRCKTSYACRSLISTGAVVAFGSDWYVAPADPLMGIYAAVTRRTLDGKNPDGWVPGEKIGVEDALKAYTVDAAYSGFEEHVKGTLEKGKLADFVVLNRDITTIPPEEIAGTRVDITVVDGKILFER